jgi:hypothetical protein
VLWVAYLETALHVSGGTTTYHQHQVAVTVWQKPDAVDTVVWAAEDGWWYHQKHVEHFPDKINCVMLHPVGYILKFSPQIFKKHPQISNFIYVSSVAAKLFHVNTHITQLTMCDFRLLPWSSREPHSSRLLGIKQW